LELRTNAELRPSVIPMERTYNSLVSENLQYI